MSDWLLIEGDPSVEDCALCDKPASILILLTKGIHLVKCLECSTKSPLRKTKECAVGHWNTKQKIIRETPQCCKVYDGKGRLKRKHPSFLPEKT
jgi:hypothetical protein